MKKPEWCPYQECKFQIQSQDKMCCGELPEKVPHDDGFNTHRFCMDTRETGHGIFDLQINWGDAWNMKRVLNAAHNPKEKIQCMYCEKTLEDGEQIVLCKECTE